MNIISLNLSGFKNFGLNTQLNFKDKNDNLIFDAESEQKYFIFEAILGVLYGCTNEDKKRFRDLENSKVFTGMITLDFADRTMLIERDFETDFVACLLSSSKKVKPFFQGKDFVQNGAKRPYLQMLRSVFPITDKNLILEICYDSKSSEPKNLSDLLDSLYLLLSPQIKISEVRSLIQNGKFSQNNFSVPEIDAPLKDQIDYLKWKKLFLIDLLKVDNRMDEIEQDIERLQILLQSIQNKDLKKDSAYTELKKNYPKIYDQNALQLRADVLLWKSLKENKIHREVKLENVSARIKKIQRVIHSDFSNYQEIPGTFENDIEKYQNLKSELADKKNNIEEFHQKLMFKESQLKLKQKRKWFVLFLLPVIVFFLSYLAFGPFWLFIVPETLIVIFAILLYFGHLNENIRADIFHINEEHRMTEFRMKEIDNEIKSILDSNPLFKDEEYLVIHVDRFKKFSDYQNELRDLKQVQASLYEILQSEQYTKQIMDYEEKYSHLININREDLEEYLDNFVDAQEKINDLRSGNSTYPGVEEISILKRKYLISYNELKSTKEKVMKKLSIDNNIDMSLDKVSRKIKNLELEFEAEHASSVTE